MTEDSRPTMTAVTPSREQEELARDLALAFHGDEVEWRGFLPKAALILSNQSYRLALNPSPDPDAMNERRAAEDARLAAKIRAATIEECAKIAEFRFAGSNLSNIGGLVAVSIRALLAEPQS